jgi:bifunctional non-homologous end joining protein LigD
MTQTRLRFVVHEHHASRVHFDFRLEVKGVLRSWAVPKGPSMNPAEKRLAILVEDHPLDYIDFEGIIPDGEYGAGPVVVWDTGDYTLEKEDRDILEFVLHGKRLRGGFALVHIKGRGKGNEWLLVKRKDEYADSDWKLESALTARKRKTLGK